MSELAKLRKTIIDMKKAERNSKVKIVENLLLRDYSIAEIAEIMEIDESNVRFLMDDIGTGTLRDALWV